MTLDTVTFWVFVGFWPAWLVWELVLLRLRATDPEKPKTISMVARDIGWKMNVLVYLWSGLGSHYWWNGSTYATVLGAAVFWGVAAALLVEDFARYLLGRTERPWHRSPLLWLVLGAFSGHFLFPQVYPA
jgi:hypothetical protein